MCLPGTRRGPCPKEHGADGVAERSLCVSAVPGERKAESQELWCRLHASLAETTEAAPRLLVPCMVTQMSGPTQNRDLHGSCTVGSEVHL